MNFLKNIILLFFIIFFNSCSVEDGKTKATFWVVSGGNTISYKDDYREWEDVTITSDAILIRDIESNNSQGLIAVGKDGNIWQSSDKGLSWDNRTSGNRTSGNGSNSRLWEVIYNSGKYVAVGNSGIIITSDDGITWDNRTSGVTKKLRGIAYGNSKYVTVGSDGTVLTSSDSITWTQQSSPTTENFFGLEYVNNKFIGVGDNGLIITSSDGTTWDNKTSGTSEKIKGITYGNGIYVTIATNGVIYTSTDTDTWTLRSSGTTNDLWAVEFGNGEFLAGGTDIAIKSNDGITWTQILSRTVQGIVYLEFDLKKWKYSPTLRFADLR